MARVQPIDQVAQGYDLVVARQPTQLLGKVVQGQMDCSVAAQRSVACGPHVVVAENDARLAESSHEGGNPDHP